jgi:hypothetical protein
MVGEDQKTTIASAIGQFQIMESRVERAWRDQADPNLVRLNKIASKILDDLNSVMIAIRQAAN